MTDPLSVAASVAGLISLGIKVTQSLVDYYTSYKDQDLDIASTNKKLESLLDIFQHLDQALISRKFEADERSLIEKIKNTIRNCDEFIGEVQDECQKFSKALSNEAKDVVKVAARRLAYPFRDNTLQKLDENIGKLRVNIFFALYVLQLKNNRKIQHDIDDTKSLLNLIRASQISSKLRD